MSGKLREELSEINAPQWTSVLVHLAPSKCIQLSAPYVRFSQSQRVFPGTSRNTFPTTAVGCCPMFTNVHTSSPIYLDPMQSANFKAHFL